MNEEKFDIAIVGAGPAGSICAYTLKQKNHALKVCLIDKSNFPREKVCGDGLGLGVGKLLLDLNLTDVLKGVKPVKTFKLLSPNRNYITADLDKLLGKGSNGYIIPRKEFDNRLFQHSISNGSVDFSGWTFCSSSFKNNEWKIELKYSTGERKNVKSRVLVGADGARSKVRKTLGLKYNSPKHTGVAIRSYVKSDNFDQETMALDYLEELLSGYGWVFPVGNNIFNIGVGIDSQNLKKSGSVLKEMLNKYFSFLKSENEFEIIKESTGSYMLTYGSQLPKLTFNRAVLIGDAASMINPFTGEGVFYAISAGKMLGEKLANSALEKDARIDKALISFEREVKDKFIRHYKLNNMLKKLWKNKLFSNMIIHSCNKDQKILAEGINLMIGNSRSISIKTIIIILFNGLFSKSISK